MDVRVEIKYRLELSRDEWLVVSKALRVFAGHPAGASDDGLANTVKISEGDREVAALLQEQMLVQKHNVLSQMANDASKAVANIDGAVKAVAQTAQPTRGSKR